MLPPRSPDPGRSRDLADALRQERKRQVRGLVLLAFAILAFSILRKGTHIVFPAGWWRLW
jgi:hypothetical protein